MGDGDKQYRKHRGFMRLLGDASNPTFGISVDSDSKALHLFDPADSNTDWNVSAASHPTLYVHSNTTPATDYVAIYQDATYGYFNVASGDIALQTAGTTRATIGAAGLSFPAGTDLTFTGTTGTNDIVLTNALADALSITDGSADIVVIDTSTTGNVFTLSAEFRATNASLNATTGRVGKFSGSVAAPNQGDGYGAFEVDITGSGTFAGTTNASSTWLNVAASAVPGGNMICVHNDGIYLPAGITASSAKMIMGMRMQYVADDGANPGSLFCFSTNIYSNVLTAIFDVNAIVDLGGSTGAQTGNDYKIPLLKDATANQVWYVNVYHS